jgi:hypothetical protein
MRMGSGGDGGRGAGGHCVEGSDATTWGAAGGERAREAGKRGGAALVVGPCLYVQ